MKKTLLIAMFSGLTTVCVTPHAAESRERPPTLAGKPGVEVRIDASAIKQRVREGKITPLPDAVNKFHGARSRSTEDKKRSQE